MRLSKEADVESLVVRLEGLRRAWGGGSLPARHDLLDGEAESGGWRGGGQVKHGGGGGSVGQQVGLEV